MNSTRKSELNRKAELYTYLFASSDPAVKNTMVPVREKALQYCQDLINDYKTIRSVSRTLYYSLQIATVVLSGVTPILVLVDKLEAGQSWLKWLPVICPALASILASVVTSFPFQENSVTANTAVELLEAEQEKFILGVTELYRCYDGADDSQQQQKARQAIENFVVQINNIHLNQVQQASEAKKQNKAEGSEESNTPALSSASNSPA